MNGEQKLLFKVKDLPYKKAFFVYVTITVCKETIWFTVKCYRLHRLLWHLLERLGQSTSTWLICGLWHRVMLYQIDQFLQNPSHNHMSVLIFVFAAEKSRWPLPQGG